MKKSLHIYMPEKKLSMNQGYVVPIACYEALPGDVLQQSTTALVRTQPLLAPVMHTMEAKIHHWFVPYRLIWPNFEKFILGFDANGDEATAVVPTITLASVAAGSLANHLGLPISAGALPAVSALPFRAYGQIWNEYYRDGALQDVITVSTADGNDTTTSTALKLGCWEKDYFTAARPNTQLGNAVTIPLTGTAPVTGIGFENTTGTVYANKTPRDSTGASPVVPWSVDMGDTTTLNNMIVSVKTNSTSAYPDLKADLSAVTAVTMNDLRLAAMLTQYKENLLRSGHRMVERLAASFGVSKQDTRLEIPSYLGGGSEVIQFSEVLQTAEGADPVGDLKGHGIAAMKSNRFKQFIPEYGVIISVLCIRPKTAYQDGIGKMWSRTTKEDYFMPELQHIGMQPILNKEVRAAHASPTAVFGYQDRYDEYRHMFDQVAGEFASTLDFWHMGRKFTSDPALNSTFVECSGVDRPFATSADEFLVRAKHKIQARRVLHNNGKPAVF